MNLCAALGRLFVRQILAYLNFPLSISLIGWTSIFSSGVAACGSVAPSGVLPHKLAQSPRDFVHLQPPFIRVGHQNDFCTFTYEFPVPQEKKQRQPRNRYSASGRTILRKTIHRDKRISFRQGKYK